MNMRTVESDDPSMEKPETLIKLTNFAAENNG